jgi:hypothetical protein
MRQVFPLLTAALLALGGAPILSQTPVDASPTGVASYTFPSGAGLLLFYVRPDKAAEFESVVARIDEALTKTPDPMRRQQAASWRIFRSVEPVSRDAAVYMFVFDPAIAGADYDPVKLLSQELPADAPALYASLKDAVVRVERMGLAKLR